MFKSYFSAIHVLSKKAIFNMIKKQGNLKEVEKQKVEIHFFKWI